VQFLPAILCNLKSAMTFVAVSWPSQIAEDMTNRGVAVLTRSSTRALPLPSPSWALSGRAGNVHFTEVPAAAPRGSPASTALAVEKHL